MKRIIVLMCCLGMFFIAGCDQSSNKKTTTNTQTENSIEHKTTNTMPQVTAEEKKEADEQWKKALATDKLRKSSKNSKPIEYWKR